MNDTIKFHGDLQKEIENVIYNAAQSETLKTRGKEWLYQNSDRIVGELAQLKGRLNKAVEDYNDQLSASRAAVTAAEIYKSALKMMWENCTADNAVAQIAVREAQRVLFPKDVV